MKLSCCKAAIATGLFVVGLFLAVATGGHSQDQQPAAKALGIKAIQASYDDALAAAAEAFDLAAEQAHADFLVALDDAILAAEGDGKPKVAARLKETKTAAEADGPPLLADRDTLKSGIDLAKLSGQWVIRYTNGATRTYQVDKSGTVVYGKLKGKLRTKNGEIVIDSLERPLWERWSLCDGRLFVEHFNPKIRGEKYHDATFPSHIGIGLRLQDIQ